MEITQLNTNHKTDIREEIIPRVKIPSLWNRLSPWEITFDTAFREFSRYLQAPETRTYPEEPGKPSENTRKGGGFSPEQNSQAIADDVIGVMAAGLASRAVEISIAYARQHMADHQPIIHREDISDHLLKMRALELLIVSMGVKTAAATNGRRATAVHYAAAAKYACCALTEELVQEGRHIHNARSLLTEHPYHRVITDAPLYGIFDGTSHLMLDQLQWRLGQLVTADIPVADPLALMKDMYATPLRNSSKIFGQTNTALFISPAGYLKQLAGIPGEISLIPLVNLAQALTEFTRRCREQGIWDEDQGLRFEAGKLLANLETLIAAIELADPERRQALGIPSDGLGTEPHRTLYRHTANWFGGRISADLGTLYLRTGIKEPHSLTLAARKFWAEAEKARRKIKQNLNWL